MRVLLVTPVLQGSGETITALNIAHDLAASGDEVHFLASPFAAQFIEPSFAGRVQELDLERGEQPAWNQALRSFRPEVILFADYPLMLLPGACAPLASVRGWSESLDAVDAALVTLDHFGWAGREDGLYLGPPHLGCFTYFEFAALPTRMQVLLPCPMHEPGPVTGRVGEPFRYWSVPLKTPEAVRDNVRRTYLDNDGLLVFHSVPTWAWQGALMLGLRFYDLLPEIFDLYFGALDQTVTIVSVNNGSLLPAPVGSRVRIVNLGPIPPNDFAALLFGSDLFITENKLSISMGKAVCGLQPCAALRNGWRLIELARRLCPGRLRDIVMAMENARLGSVYRYDVFPNLTPEDTEAIGLYRESSFPLAFRELEIYGGDETADALRRLLLAAEERDALRTQQQAYVDKVAMLPTGAEILRRVSS